VDLGVRQVRSWQSRPLESTYALVFFDALRVKIRDEGLVRNKAVYLAIGVHCSGHKEFLGLWIEQTEGAKFWLRVMNELKARGVGDILIAFVDGLKGFPEAITAVFPDAVVQSCIVHLIRNSVQLASWKDRKALAQAFKRTNQNRFFFQRRWDRKLKEASPPDRRRPPHLPRTSNEPASTQTLGQVTE
jgi:putative transposase